MSPEWLRPARRMPKRFSRVGSLKNKWKLSWSGARYLVDFYGDHSGVCNGWLYLKFRKRLRLFRNLNWNHLEWTIGVVSCRRSCHRGVALHMQRHMPIWSLTHGPWDGCSYCRSPSQPYPLQACSSLMSLHALFRHASNVAEGCSNPSQVINFAAHHHTEINGSC